MNEQKRLSFELILAYLIQWYIQESNINFKEFNEKNDFSKLKVLKLLFFTVAINSRRNNLLNTFDQFYALPLGHVELDIYQNISNLEYFKIDDRRTNINSFDNYSSIEDIIKIINNGIKDENTKKEIKDSIESLKSKNSSLVLLTASKLVDLSHLWFSWRSTFKKAKSKNSLKEIIPTNYIQKETKLFTF